MEGALNIMNNQIFNKTTSGNNTAVLITSGNPTNITWSQEELDAAKNFTTIYGVTSQVDDTLLVMYFLLLLYNNNYCSQQLKSIIQQITTKKSIIFVNLAQFKA